MVVGDAPGSAEARKGVPFVGQTGSMIRGTLQVAGIDPEQVYYTNAVMCHADGSEKPSSDMVRNCSIRLIAEIEEVRPQKILLAGSSAMQALSPWLTPKPPKFLITKIRGLGMEMHHPGLDFVPYVVPTWHPGKVLKEPEVWRDLAQDCVKLATRDRTMVLPPVEKHVVRTWPDLREALTPLLQASVVSCDLETTGFRPMFDRLLSTGFGALYDDLSGYTVVIDQRDFNANVRQEIWEWLQEFKGTLVFHNGKFDAQFLHHYFGRPIEGPFRFADTMMLSALADDRSSGRSEAGGNEMSGSGQHGLKYHARVRYDIPDYHFNFDAFFKRMEAGEVKDEEWEAMWDYHAVDLYATCRLYKDLVQELNEEDPDLISVHDRITAPGQRLFAKIEYGGVPVDEPYLEGVSAELELKAKGILDRLRLLAGKFGYPELNPNSEPQVADLLMNRCGLRIQNTEKESLFFARESCKRRHEDDIAELITLILEYRQWSRLRSKDVEGLKKLIEPDGYVRPDFQVGAGTATGRLSCRNPNLQNVATLIGPMIERCFVSQHRIQRQVPVPWDRSYQTIEWDGEQWNIVDDVILGRGEYVWVKYDWSQLELRVAAFLSQDPNMIQAYLDNRDIHREVASTMFKKPPEEILDYERYLAKYVDFGVI
jgi:uracil-DNA glycosylase family 4